jgi:SPP1 family predicted phage head-tail adaptor
MRAKTPIGRRDQLLTIQRPIETQDEDGGVLQSWVTVRQVMGAVKEAIGNERTIAQGVNAQVEYKIHIPRFDGFGPEMRLASGSRTFDITSIPNLDTRDHLLELRCTERI